MAVMRGRVPCLNVALNLSRQGVVRGEDKRHLLGGGYTFRALEDPLPLDAPETGPVAMAVTVRTVRAAVAGGDDARKAAADDEVAELMRRAVPHEGVDPGGLANHRRVIGDAIETQGEVARRSVEGRRRAERRRAVRDEGDGDEEGANED